MNIKEIDKWLKEENGISYTEMSDEFNGAMELLEKYIKRYERLHSIIKEVREYIEKMTFDNPDTDFELEVNTVLGNVLEILDKDSDK